MRASRFERRRSRVRPVRVRYFSFASTVGISLAQRLCPPILRRVVAPHLGRRHLVEQVLRLTGPVRVEVKARQVDPRPQRVRVHLDRLAQVLLRLFLVALGPGELVVEAAPRRLGGAELVPGFSDCECPSRSRIFLHPL